MAAVAEVLALPHYREPVVGQDVCLPTSLYLGHGRDDFQGGMCTITKVIDRRDDPDCTALEYNKLSVEVKERPGWQSNWYNLMEKEPENVDRYGNRRGFPDPDLDPEFNDW